MIIFKLTAKPVNLFVQAIISCLSIGIGTIIYSYFADQPGSVIAERIFFQSCGILTFAWILSRNYVVYNKDEAVKEIDTVSRPEEVKKPKEFTF